MAVKRTGLAFALVCFCFALLVAACGGGSSSKAAPQPSPDPTQVAGNGAPEQALAAYVSTTMQKEFLDDCGKTDAAKDAGKICAPQFLVDSLRS